MWAQRRPRLIDSARLPRQPWFPVTVFCRAPVIVPGVRCTCRSLFPSPSSSSCTVSSSGPYPSTPSLPLSSYIDAIDKKNQPKKFHLNNKNTAHTHTLHKHLAVLTKASCDSYHIYLEGWCHCAQGAFNFSPLTHTVPSPSNRRG